MWTTSCPLSSQKVLIQMPLPWRYIVQRVLVCCVWHVWLFTVLLKWTACYACFTLLFCLTHTLCDYLCLLLNSWYIYTVWVVYMCMCFCRSVQCMAVPCVCLSGRKGTLLSARRASVNCCVCWTSSGLWCSRCSHMSISASKYIMVC